MKINEFARALSRACAEKEGFFVTEAQAKARKIRWPTQAQRNNNPGNLMDVQHYKKIKQFRVMKYKTLANGWQAAENWWKRRINEGYTLEAAIHRYAPRGHGDNKPENYIAFVAEKLTLNPLAPLKEYIDAKPT